MPTRCFIRRRGIMPSLLGLRRLHSAHSRSAISLSMPACSAICRCSSPSLIAFIRSRNVKKSTPLLGSAPSSAKAFTPSLLVQPRWSCSTALPSCSSVRASQKSSSAITNAVRNSLYCSSVQSCWKTRRRSASRRSLRSLSATKSARRSNSPSSTSPEPSSSNSSMRKAISWASPSLLGTTSQSLRARWDVRSERPPPLLPQCDSKTCREPACSCLRATLSTSSSCLKVRQPSLAPSACRRRRLLSLFCSAPLVLSTPESRTTTPSFAVSSSFATSASSGPPWQKRRKDSWRSTTSCPQRSRSSFVRLCARAMARAFSARPNSTRSCSSAARCRNCSKLTIFRVRRRSPSMVRRPCEASGTTSRTAASTAAWLGKMPIKRTTFTNSLMVRLLLQSMSAFSKYSRRTSRFTSAKTKRTFGMIHSTRSSKLTSSELTDRRMNWICSRSAGFLARSPRSARRPLSSAWSRAPLPSQS
mmetsp:Transcript_38303/g.106750  ORF Transcript_38303/g.106750 Transcript_38303/m.106750 type:complete len:474 (+) Transcript_38303:232-1653(+)